MKDKICLITGTASGMGRIAAKSLAEKGTTLILVDFDTENGHTYNHEEFIDHLSHVLPVIARTYSKLLF